MNLALYHDPHYGGMGITQSWIDKSLEAPHLHQRSPRYDFDRFLALWAAFNSWGMCVTLAETDAAMIRALATSPDVKAVFAHVTRDGRFRERFEAVTASFPLPSFSDLLRINPQYNWRAPRDDAYWAEIGRAVTAGKKVRLSPGLDPDGPIWKDVLDCTYKVRCNLVHGGKMASADEAEFVSVFADLLHELLTDPALNLLHLGRDY